MGEYNQRFYGTSDGKINIGNFPNMGYPGRPIIIDNSDSPEENNSNIDIIEDVNISSINLAELDNKLISELKIIGSTSGINIVDIKWLDGYEELFKATEVRIGYGLLFMHLKNGKKKNIPLQHVRYFDLYLEDNLE